MTSRSLDKLDISDLKDFRKSSTLETLSATIGVIPESFVLSGIDYFHPHTTREFSEQILTEDGDFLVRQSRQLEYILSVKNRNDVTHIKANEDNNNNKMFYFCYTNVAYPTVNELIADHFNNKRPVIKEKPQIIHILRPVATPPWVFNPTKIETQDFIARGSCCDVWSGMFTAENGQREQIALKIPRSTKVEQSGKLLRESRLMQKLKHSNIVAWRGVVYKDEESMLILEFVRRGPLAQMLDRLTPRGKIKVCMDIAKGLNYLHSNHLIHRNVTMKSCLCDVEPSGSMIVKLSGLCLCASAAEISKNKVDSFHQIPIAWTAPESLTNEEWSFSSDVWSFGVLLWELFAKGQSPYQNVLNKVDVETLDQYLVKSNKRLKPPIGMQRDMIEIMNSCFQLNPNNRPKMSEVVDKITSIYESVKK